MKDLIIERAMYERYDGSVNVLIRFFVIKNRYITEILRA